MGSDGTDAMTTVLGGLDPILAKSPIGIAGGHALIAIAVLALAWLIRKPVSRLILRLVRSLMDRAGSGPNEDIIAALDPPVRLLLLIVAALVLNEVLILSPRLKALGEDIVRSALTFALFWAFYRIAPPVGRILDRRTASRGPELVDWGVWLMQCLALALGTAAILDIWGIHVGPMLTGLGLFGAAVALGAQDVFKNLIAGIFIIGERPFRNGDWIKSDGVVEGVVEMIGLRTTRVRQFDLAPVYVPNSALSDVPVINFSQMPYSRVDWLVTLDAGVADAEARRIRAGIETLLTQSADVVQPPAVPLIVRFEAYAGAAASVTGPRIMVYAFLKTTDWAKSMELRETLAYAIRQLVEGAGQVSDGNVQPPSQPPSQAPSVPTP